jgi:hypothetical protein
LSKGGLALGCAVKKTRGGCPVKCGASSGLAALSLATLFTPPLPLHRTPHQGHLYVASPAPHAQHRR